MTRSDECYLFPLKALSRGARDLSTKISIMIANRGSKGTYICCFKIVIIPLCIPRDIFRGSNLFGIISRSLSNEQLVWFLDDA